MCVCVCIYIWASQVVLVVRNSPANARDMREAYLIPGLGRPLEEGMATHSNILPWRIPWTKEPGWIWSIGSQRVGHDWSDLAHAHTHTRTHKHTRTHTHTHTYIFSRKAPRRGVGEGAVHRVIIWTSTFDLYNSMLFWFFSWRRQWHPTPVLLPRKSHGRRRQWHPTPVLLPGKSHGRRSLVGCSPWGRWGLDTTEQLHFHFSLSCIGEGNGNPLQCSCLENPRDGGAWWAAIYGVTQSWTWLKWLSIASTVYIVVLKNIYIYILWTRTSMPALKGNKSARRSGGEVFPSFSCRVSSGNRCCRSLWFYKRSKVGNMSTLLWRMRKQKGPGAAFRYMMERWAEIYRLQPDSSLIHASQGWNNRLSVHLDSESTASLPSCPEIQYFNQVKDVWQAQLCSWDTALAHLRLTCATPGMLGHSTLKLTSGWTGGILAVAEKRHQSCFSYLNFWFKSKSQKMQPTLSNSQDVDAARQFLAHWTTTSHFLDQEDTPETNLPWFRPCWPITHPARVLPLLDLLPANELHILRGVLILLH